MAKLFPIGIEVEEVAVGKVLRILNQTPGVAKLHLNLMNEQENGLQIEALGTETGGIEPTEIKQVLPPVKKSKPGSMQMVVAEMLAVAPVHHTIIAAQIKRSGYAAISTYSVITKMLSNGFIRRTAPGTYALTPKGSRHYAVGGQPEKRRAAPPASGREANNDDGVRGLVLKSLNNATQLVARDLQRILVENDYSPKNMTGTVGKMRREGLIASDDGVYSITEQGRAILNGSAASTQETTIES